MNVYCVICKSEMEIIEDLGTELKVYPCGCQGKQPVCKICGDTGIAGPTLAHPDGEACECTKDGL